MKNKFKIRLTSKVLLIGIIGISTILLINYLPDEKISSSNEQIALNQVVISEGDKELLYNGKIILSALSDEVQAQLHERFQCEKSYVDCSGFENEAHFTLIYIDPPGNKLIATISPGGRYDFSHIYWYVSDQLDNKYLSHNISSLEFASISPDGEYMVMSGGCSHYACDLYVFDTEDFTQIGNIYDVHLAVYPKRDYSFNEWIDNASFQYQDNILHGSKVVETKYWTYTIGDGDYENRGEEPVK